ncbi:reticulon-like protein B8 [Punica granatum]|uniref:Reticulon-like protein n=2 Tax=Punica granatum TaxID=22663 RepID=A0A218X1G3_PUNGR|nr:reticulon-like protein B8 [Punica granatum]OWM78783.1 hypothetical protein CDL15_Pgr002954 [Punica granatum]PKI31334.1 hypothetical protein CRG98_048260 [Punica granatum]
MPENLLGDIMETLSESVQKQEAASAIQEEISKSVNSQFNRLFGRQKSIHHVLGGGKSADVFLWRNKKISGSVLVGATVVWILFEWLNYNFLSIVCFLLILGMLAQFLWANASGFLNRSSKEVPRLVLPDELFINIGHSVGIEVNRALAFLQDVAVGGNLKQFLAVVGSLFAAAIIGSWFNFLTVLYIGFIAAHTLPVLYEKYEDQVDDFVYQVLGQLQHHYGKLNDGVLSRVTRGRFKGKKHE